MGLRELKERLLEDFRAVVVARDIKNLVESATDEEAFLAALREGDIEGAAEYSEFSTEELHDRIGSMRHLSERLAEKYPEVAEADPNDVAEA